MMSQKQVVPGIQVERDRIATHRCNGVCDHVPVPEYDPEIEAAALAELDTLTDAFRQAEGILEAARNDVQDAILKHLRARSAPPGKIAEHSPYDRNHVGRLRDAAGIPPLRPATVKPVKRARKKTAD